MATANQPSASPTITCGACKSPNAGDAQFCQSCGHPLYEPCVGCSKPTLLGQSFCGNCGQNLIQACEDQKAKLAQVIADGIGKAKAHDYEGAEVLLEQVSSITDYRFKDVVQKANAAIEKIRLLANHQVGNASSTLDEAKLASESGDHVKVIELLSPIPEALLGVDGVAMLEKSKTFRSELARLETDAQQSIEKKDWLMAGSYLDQLLQFLPDQSEYRKLAKAVGKKLVSKSEKYFSAHRYGDALAYLDSVPKILHGEKYLERRQVVENVNWISEQFSDEPFATPMLGRLAVRWTKDAPDDSNAAQWVKKLATELKGISTRAGESFSKLDRRSQGRLWRRPRILGASNMRRRVGPRGAARKLGADQRRPRACPPGTGKRAYQ